MILIRIFNKLAAQWKEIKSHVFLNKAEKEIIRINKTFVSSGSLSPLKILVQMPESYAEYILFSSLIRALKKDYKLDLNWINVNNSFQRAGKTGFLKRNRFFERKWTKLYTSLGGIVAFSHLFYKNRINPQYVLQAEALFQGLKSKADVLAIEIDQIRVGDLVYDTYLRYKPAATVNIEDPFLKEIIILAFHIVSAAKDYLSTSKIDLLITSYGAYIHHGIMVRVALSKNIRVFSFGSLIQIAKEVHINFPLHVKEYFSYPEKFSNLNEDQKALGKKYAREYLENRFSGRKDLSTYYMNTSVFKSETSNAERIFDSSGKKRVVIFLHCFFDSPHEYRRMLYTDFYEWIRRTLVLASNQDYDLYVKPHPNGMPGNDKIVAELKADFPKVQFIPKNVNNLKLIQEGFDLALTVHGTLGHEYPYFGIPVLNAGDNPHAEYDFCVHPKSIEEYEGFLANIDTIPKPNESDREKIHEFYFMHNIYHMPGMLSSEETAFVNSNSRDVRWKEDFDQYVEKCKDPKFLEKMDQLVYRAFKEVF